MQAPVKKPRNAVAQNAAPHNTAKQRPAQQKQAVGKRPAGNHAAPAKGSHKPVPKQPQKRKQHRSLTAGEKRGAQMLLAILFVAAVLYLLVVLIIAFFIWYSFGTPAESTTLYALRVVESDGETRIASYSVEEANNRYGLYVPYSVLASHCDFGVAGDSEQVTLYLPDAGGSTGSILCNRDSSLIEINGSSVRLPSPVLFAGSDYLLPVSLFENYLTGLDIAYDDEKQICILTVPASPAFSLKLHRPEPAEPCTSEQLAAAESYMGASGDPSGADTSNNADEPEE